MNDINGAVEEIALPVTVVKDSVTEIGAIEDGVPNVELDEIRFELILGIGIGRGTDTITIGRDVGMLSPVEGASLSTGCCSMSVTEPS